MIKLSIVCGVVVRRRRQALGLSQEELADRADLHRTYISLIERGLRSLSVETVFKLAKGLGITGSQLFEDIEREYKQTPDQP
jgi:transcriptional regulator with XRE-family HTH domain